MWTLLGVLATFAIVGVMIVLAVFLLSVVVLVTLGVLAVATRRGERFQGA
ncbi:hypothetical protein [Thermoactinospora rubra]|nr:hypothetical protein [Thermoactinospora rubra]